MDYAKKCKQCEQEFEIGENEKKFFQNIGFRFTDKKFEIPLPNLCPDCRNQRRQMYRNDRSFYRRKCDLSQDQFVSIYPADSPYTVYKPSEWYSDKWNAMDFGRKYDFSRPFFEQFFELMKEVPRLGIDIVNCENSEFCNYCGDDKDCYLDIAGEANEDCYFNLFVKYSRNTVDCTFVYNSELCYESLNCYDCYNVQESMYLDNCSDCYFCYDLKGCRDCIFSTGLRNKQYFIFNEQKTKEEYENYLKRLYLGSYQQRNKLRQGWRKFKIENGLFRDANLINCENCSGNNLKNCKNTFYSFNATNCEDCRYLYDVLDAKDCQDLNYSLYKPELSYELISTLNMVKSAFSMASHYNNEVYYCDLTNNSSNLFGCIGLNHKQYCILNKQYTREEYEELVPRIVEQMRETGEWGEFFPGEFSPFAYNETVANEYFPLSKDEVLKRGWQWSDQAFKPESADGDCDIPDSITEVDDDICGKSLLCEEGDVPFRIIRQELDFYRKMNIPIPRCSPNLRHKKRTDLRNPRKLWDRKCDKCGKEVKSSFAPERSERVLCEECYLREVY